MKFMANPVVFGPNTEVFEANTVVFGANTVVFRANTVIYGANTVVLGANTVLFLFTCGNLVRSGRNGRSKRKGNFGRGGLDESIPIFPMY